MKYAHVYDTPTVILRVLVEAETDSGRWSSLNIPSIERLDEEDVGSIYNDITGLSRDFERVLRSSSTHGLPPECPSGLLFSQTYDYDPAWTLVSTVLRHPWKVAIAPSSMPLFNKKDLNKVAYDTCQADLGAIALVIGLSKHLDPSRIRLITWRIKG